MIKKGALLTVTAIIGLTNILLAQTIKIDYQLPTQPIPDIYKPGIFFVPKTEDGNNDFKDNEIHFNSIRTIAIETALNHYTVSSISGVMDQLELMKENILYAASRCDKLVIPILKMPAWLSSSTDTTRIIGGFMVLNSMPPKDYSTWNLLMDSIVNKITDQWGINAYYEIWNEPNIEYWLGTEAEYFEFFRNTYFAVKENHPNAKIGGPTVSGFISQFTPTLSNGYLTDVQLDSTIIGMVIDSCMSWNARLDFISWHNFGVNLHVQEMIFDYLNRKLISSGHGVVPFIISEWNLSHNLRESALDASFMINYTQALVNQNVLAHQVAAWQDFDPGSTEFHEDYGLISWRALHKPSWKALQLLNSLSGVLLQTDNSDYKGLNIIPSFENDTLKVLVSNFTLTPFEEAALSLYFDHEVNSKQLIDNGYTSSMLESIWQEQTSLAGSDPLSLAINSVIPTYKIADSLFNNGRDINFIFPGITGIHTGKITLIDSTHNNVIYKYDSLTSIGYDRASAINYLYPNNSFDTENINITDSLYSIHIQANAVMLIELYLPEIVLSLRESSSDSFPIFYPNPTSDIVHVNMNEQDLDIILLYDLNGRFLKKLAMPSFSLENFPNGIYIIKIKAKNEIWTRKLIKE